MREFPGFIPATDASTFTNSVALNIGDNVNAWIGIQFTGNDVVGTAKIQASPDNSNWWDVADSSQSITASTRHAWNISDMHAVYLRVAWTYTSGTGDISGIAQISEQMLHRGG